jgi:hypothetical protein
MCGYYRRSTRCSSFNRMQETFYLNSRRCGLKVKTEERLAVPWDAGDLVAQAKALTPEGQTVALRDKGITELRLARLNARLAPLECVIYASIGGDSKRMVTCTGEDGRVEQFGLFELRPISTQSSESMTGIQC